MDDLYDLYSKRTKYRNLKEDLSNAIYVLSRGKVNDSMSNLKNALSSNYLVNDVPAKNDTLSNITERISTDLNSLRTCLSLVETQINKLTKEIEAAEATSSF